jgi:alpha-1,6-mannosyltransferase
MLRISSRRISVAIALLTFTAVVFRAEVVLLLGPLALQFLLFKQISFVNLIKVGLISGLPSLGSSFIMSVELTLINEQ